MVTSAGEQMIYIYEWKDRSDATIIAARFDYLNLSVGASYDVNVSTLQDASNAMGGPEVSLTFTSDLPTTDRKVDCPKF